MEMKDKPIYSSGFPIIPVVVYAAPFLIFIFLLTSEINFLGALFYGSALVIVSFLLNKDYQWIRLYKNKIIILNFNPFVGQQSIFYKEIDSIVGENGIETMIFVGSDGMTLIPGVQDRLYLKCKEGAGKKRFF